jgi:hypothetical protein
MPPVLARWLKSLNGAAGASLVALALVGAPVQCAAHREPRRVRVTPPADAVYEAAESLRRQGYAQAHEATLRYIIEQYPGTRAAARAEDDLERSGP